MLEKQRSEIDRIDAELVKLFEQRMDCVTEIGRIKRDNQLAVFDNSREQLVLEKAQSRLQNKAYQQAVSAFFQHLMNVTKDYQNNIINHK
ncbi:chorismate mutase [Utexia brackfieldae]|uniref:chorismate mutase n=1 Tax=Utexia brackfieldae TaxID=3074108 RepID=UPI00370D3755